MRSAFYRACFPAAKQARKPVWRVHQLPDGLNFPTAGGHALEAVEQHHRCEARAGGIYRWQESVGNHLFQPDEYLLPADLVSLALAEMETLLEIVQGWIREKHKGRAAVIQLPEDDSHNETTN